MVQGCITNRKKSAPEDGRSIVKLIKDAVNPNLLLKEEKMNSLTIRIGWLMFVIYGLTCLVSLMHKNFYW